MQKSILIIKPYVSDNNSFLLYIENETNFKLFCADKLEKDFKGVMIFSRSKDDLKKFRKKNNKYGINFQLEDDFIGVMIFCRSKDDLKKFRNKNNEYLINFQLEDEVITNN